MKHNLLFRIVTERGAGGIMFKIVTTELICAAAFCCLIMAITPDTAALDVSWYGLCAMFLGGLVIAWGCVVASYILERRLVKVVKP